MQPCQTLPIASAVTSAQGVVTDRSLQTSQGAVAPNRTPSAQSCSKVEFTRSFCVGYSFSTLAKLQGSICISSWHNGTPSLWNFDKFCAMGKAPGGCVLTCWMTSCSHFIQIFWRQFLQHILDLVQLLALRRPQMSPTAYFFPGKNGNYKQRPQTKQSTPHHTNIVHCTSKQWDSNGVKRIFKSHQVRVTALSRWHHRSFLLRSWG